MTESDRVDAVVAQWRRERPDLDTEAMGIIGRFGRVAMFVENAINETFTRHGLQRGEFDVLAALRRSGAPFELNPSTLADMLMLSRAGMTGRIDRLETAGLVRRTAAARDRRSVDVRLTDQGRDVIDVVVAEHVANETRLLAALSVQERREFDRIARRLLASFEAPEP